MSRWQFTVAHAEPTSRTPSVYVRVYRTHRRAALRTALKKAVEIRRAGYLVWIERTGEIATR
jgi:hypothetical protein